MNETSHTPSCSRCGAPLTPDALKGLCPRCLMALNLAAPTEIPGETGPHGTKVVKPPPPLDEIAKHFPQFEILECLGRGGMGVVYKARQPKLNRLVALKILAPEKEAEPRFAERFEREAQALARLNHPNIVTVYDFGETDGLYYLTMEFMDGVSLRQLLQTRKIAPEEALAIVPKICEALQFAHDQGVVHRDIKPENVLLDKKGRVKIADFGIAKIVGGTFLSPSDGERLSGRTGEATLTQDQVLGTPHYMAPEQVEKPQLVDHRADIYSLGVVFYEILTGELPLGKFAPPSKKVQMDVRLDEVVLHALEKEPDRRYQHASEVKTDVETIAATAPGSSGRGCAPSEDARPRATTAAGSNAKEATIVFAGTFFFAFLLAVVVELSRASVVPFKEFLIVLSIVGLGICGLSLAGLWPFPSPWFPEPNFSSRNLRRGKGQPVSPTEIGAARNQVKAPANWLVATGILNWVAIPLIVLVTAAVASQSPAHNYYVLFVPLATLVLSSVMIVAGLKMKRLEAYGLAITGSILAILITPGNVIGLPIGIWALVVLSHRQVRQAFGKGYSLPLEAAPSAAPPASRPDRFWRRFAVAVALVLLAMILIPVGTLLLAVAIPNFIKARQRAQTIAADSSRVVRVEEKLQQEIERRLGEAGWRVEGISVSVTPDLKRAECRFGTASKNGLSEIPFNASIRIEPQGKNLWLVTGDGQFQFLRFSVDASAEMAATQDSPPPMAALLASFGPVREVTLNDIDELRGAEVLDLDSGQLLDLRKDLETRPESERLQWLENQSADLLLDHVDGRWGLMTIADNELKLVPLLNNSWEASSESSLSNALAGPPGGVKADPQRVWRIFAGGRWEMVREKDITFPLPPALDFKQRGAWRVYVLATNAQPPQTFAFKTASGARGLLQITRFTEKPNSVQLRYKLVQSNAASAQSVMTHHTSADDPDAPNSYIAASLAGMDLAVEKIKEAAARGGLSETADVFNHFNELCDQLQGKNQNPASTSQDWGIQGSDEFRTITDGVSALEDASERMRDIARGNRRSKAEREAILKEEANKFVNRYAEFKALLKSAAKTKRAAVPRPNERYLHEGLGFGPVIERVVTNMIDFDSGALVDLPLPTQPGERDPERYEWINGKEGVPWMRQQGVDAINGNHGLIGLDLWLLPLERKEWQSLTSATLQDKLQDVALPAAPSSEILGDARSTYGFKTREGGLGIVQITDTAIPRGVKIRYKLVQGPNLSVEDAGQTVAGLPPVVVETLPVSGARDVEPGVREIRVRFSKEMRDGSWSWATAWQDSKPEVIGEPRYEPDHRTCVIKAKFEPGRTYAFWLNSEKFHNFTDLAARPAVPYLLIFQTKHN